MGRVVVVGSVSVDLVARVPRHPRPGETVLAEEPLARLAGGKGANQAVAAAAAGASVVLVGAVGDDDAGRASTARLRDLGIETRLTVARGHPTGTAWITVDEAGESTVVVLPGANRAVRPTLDDLRSDDLLLLQRELPRQVVHHVVRGAVRVGARVVLDAAPFAPLPPAVAAAADPLVVDEEGAGALADSGLVPGSLLVTFGEAGAQWDAVRVDAVPVPSSQVRDTTGAQDAFCGALAAALVAGAGRRAALGAATEAAAACVRHVGAQPGPFL